MNQNIKIPKIKQHQGNIGGGGGVLDILLALNKTIWICCQKNISSEGKNPKPDFPIKMWIAGESREDPQIMTRQQGSSYPTQASEYLLSALKSHPAEKDLAADHVTYMDKTMWDGH